MRYEGFPTGSAVKNLPLNSGDGCSVPGSGRPPAEGNGNPLQYSCHGQKCLAGYSPWGYKRVTHDLPTKQQ